MKKIKRTIMSLLLMALLISCQTSNDQTPLAETDTPDDIWATWLSLSVCEPPCWQGITPGVTAASEAVSILEGMPDVKIKYQGETGLFWDFKDNTEGGEIRFNDGVVSRVTLSSISDKKLPLVTVIKAYGVPKYVEPYDCREGMCITALVYPEMGMVLDIFVPNTGNMDGPRIEILATTAIDRVYFLKEGLDGFKMFPELQRHKLMKWKGYATYP